MNRPPCRVVFAAAWLALCSGCSPISTDYGRSKGTSGRQSLNGFGALRRSYEHAGYRSRDVSRLSDRVMRTDVIVWTPRILGTVNNDVTRWFERWLGRGGRTLVYIVPDSGSEADYWIDAAAIAPPEQRLEYRKRAAKSINERMMWRLNRIQVQSNGWFQIKTLRDRKRLGKISGQWADSLGPMSSAEAKIAVEYLVGAYDADDQQAATVGVGATNTGPTGPGTPGWTFPSETAATKTPVRCSELVGTQTGESIVIEIGSKRWEDSRIIVVAGGSLLTNYAFTRDWNRRLAVQIIDRSTPNAKQRQLSAGFLTSDWNDIPVSEKQPGVPEASGMELLTVWPMSLVTMHGVMLGLVICLMLFPIFGGPGKFGVHVRVISGNTLTPSPR